MKKSFNKYKIFLIFAVAILGFFLSGCNTLDGVEEISIIEDKNRTSDEFDYKWYQVELIYQSGKTKLIPLTESMIREYDRLLFYKAGTHTIHVDTYKRTATFEITVAMNSFGDDIKFEDATFEYDGNPHKIEVQGDLPEGTKVIYKLGNEFTNAAIYDLEASLVCDGYYVKTLNATMKITKTNYDMSGFKYDVANYVYTGKEQGPTIVANLPKDLKVDYTIQQYVNGTYTEETSGYKAINAGEYKVTAKFKNNNPNYNNVKDVEIKFQINKNEILIDDVFLEDKEYVYDGDYKNLVLTFAPGAKSLPKEVSWGLYYNDEIIEEGMKDVGEYDIEARFTTSNPNYIVSSVIKGKLTITPAIISMASIVFESESFVYSPTESRCILCNADSKNFEKEKYVSPPPYVVFMGYCTNTDPTIKSKIEYTNVGKYQIYACFKCSDNNHSIEGFEKIEATIEILPVQYELDEVHFYDKEFTYVEGTTYSLEYTLTEGYTLPDFVHVEYENNEITEIGSFQVKVIFTSTDPNYVIVDGVRTAWLVVVG